MNNIKEGYKMTELGEIPEEWKLTKLQSIAQICYGKNQKDVEVENGKYDILGTGGIIGKTDKFLWNKPSVLIGRKGTIDKPQYIEEPFWTVDTLFYTKINEKYIAKWLYYYLNNIDLKKYNEATGVPSLSASVLNKITIVTPSKSEQQKISAILSSVDEQIENIDNLIEKIKELKKGLMQKLLRKGIGHSKFKDTEIGRIPEDWEVHKLERYVEIRSGNSPSSFELLEEGKYPFYKVDDMNYTEKYLNNSKVWFDETSFQLMPKDMVVFPKRGASIFTNKVAILSRNGYFDTNIMGLTCKNDLFNEYLFYQLKFIGLKKFADTTAIPQINNKHINPLIIPIPKLEEQKQIVSILSSVDEQIALYKSKKDILQEVKEGLMQELLTGKTRVCVNNIK